MLAGGLPQSPPILSELAGQSRVHGRIRPSVLRRGRSQLALVAATVVSVQRPRRWQKGLRCSKGADASTPRLEFLDDDPSCYTIGILGDLHLDPRDLEDSMIGRQHMKDALEGQPNAFAVSLGDLGESKDCNDTQQLFSGTSPCFELARESWMAWARGMMSWAATMT